MPGATFIGETLAGEWTIILPVVLPLIGAGVLLMLRAFRDFHWLFALLIVLSVLGCALDLTMRTIDGPVAMTMGNWLPPFGISFTVDILGASFTLLSSFVVLVLLVYLQVDAPRHAKSDGLYSLILLLLAGVCGAFLTGDLFNLYVWFEVMLIASFGLMVLGGRPLQLDATVKYGFLNFLATSIFLLALGLLYGLLGTLNMADIVRVAPTAEPAPLAGIAALLLLAFGMKAAAFPVNAWLPASYHAPPVAISALLASLLTKVGAYALLRSLAMLLPESRTLLEPVLLTVAVATLVLGPLGAIAETNLRRALGFFIIGGIGSIVAGLTLAGQLGLSGAAAYAMHAIVTIAALYMVAGLIENATGATDTRQMGGLYAANAPVSILFLVLVLAIAGVPPFLGFWPKLLLLEAGLDRAGIAGVGNGLDWGTMVLTLAVLLNALMTLIAGTRLWSHVFWRQGHEGPQSEALNPGLRPLSQRERWLGTAPTAVLTTLVLLLGLYPQPLLQAATAAAAGLLDPGGYVAVTLEGDQ